MLRPSKDNASLYDAECDDEYSVLLLLFKLVKSLEDKLDAMEK